MVWAWGLETKIQQLSKRLRVSWKRTLSLTGGGDICITEGTKDCFVKIRDNKYDKGFDRTFQPFRYVKLETQNLDFGCP